MEIDVMSTLIKIVALVACLFTMLIQVRASMLKYYTGVGGSMFLSVEHLPETGKPVNMHRINKVKVSQLVMPMYAREGRHAHNQGVTFSTVKEMRMAHLLRQLGEPDYFKMYVTVRVMGIRQYLILVTDDFEKWSLSSSLPEPTGYHSKGVNDKPR